MREPELGASISDSSADADPDEIEIFTVYRERVMKCLGNICRNGQSKCSLLNKISR